METKEVDMELEKETKNTYRYATLPNNSGPSPVKTIYVQKATLPEEPPKRIKVAVSEID